MVTTQKALFGIKTEKPTRKETENCRVGKDLANPKRIAYYPGTFPGWQNIDWERTAF